MLPSTKQVAPGGQADHREGLPRRLLILNSIRMPQFGKFAVTLERGRGEEGRKQVGAPNATEEEAGRLSAF